MIEAPSGLFSWMADVGISHPWLVAFVLVVFQLGALAVVSSIVCKRLSHASVKRTHQIVD